VDPRRGDARQRAHLRRPVALLGDADEQVGAPERRDDLGRAREEGADAHRRRPTARRQSVFGPLRPCTSTVKLIPPCSQTGVGGATGTIRLPPPGGGTTRMRWAVRSHWWAKTGSPVPGTSGEKRASAEEYLPGATTTRTAVVVPGLAGVTCVGSPRP